MKLSRKFKERADNATFILALVAAAGTLDYVLDQLEPQNASPYPQSSQPHAQPSNLDLQAKQAELLEKRRIKNEEREWKENHQKAGEEQKSPIKKIIDYVLG